MTVTLDELANALQTAADESAQTNRILNDEVIPRLGRLEVVVSESGLNGHTDLLKKFLDNYAAGQTKDQAWAVVRADLGHRFRWLRSPKSWLKAVFYAILGGLGWQIASGHPPHIPGIH